MPGQAGGRFFPGAFGPVEESAARACPEVARLDHERHRAHAELAVIAGRIAGIVDDHDPAKNPLVTG